MAKAGLDLAEFAECDSPWIWDVVAASVGELTDGCESGPEG